MHGRGFYYGWVIVGVIFISNLVTFSPNPSFGLFVTRFEKEFGYGPGIVDLKDRDDFRAEATRYSGWLEEKLSPVDYRAYVAGIRNIEGHYFYDTFGTLEPHVDVHSPVLKRNPERVRLAVEAASELTLCREVAACQEPENGGQCADENRADGINEIIVPVDAIPTDSTGSDRTLDSGKPGNGMTRAFPGDHRRGIGYGNTTKRPVLAIQRG